MSDRTLCLWRKNDQITAQRLNQMTCAINANTTRSEENSCKIGSIFSGSYQAVSGLPNERYISGQKEQFMQQNRGFIIDEWDYCGTPENTGVYVRQSGFESAQSHCYPDAPCLKKLAPGTVGNETKEIMQIISTDEYGKVKESKIELMSTVPNDTKLWQGPSSAGSEYKFYRRLGRVVNACYEFSEGSTKINKVMETNDLVMPILPARAEKEENQLSMQSLSLVGDFKENSVLIKNIKNGGGLDLTPCTTNLQLKSGVEFHAGATSTSDSGSTSTTYPTLTNNVKPQEFDITIACIPIKEQHYVWCKTSNSWVETTTPSSDSTSEPSTAEPTKKGDIKITAKSLGGNNWQIGWASTGEVVIPVKDFTPSEAITYDEGRGISLCKQTVNDGTEENPVWGSKYVICNTMEICAGCGISVEQTDTEKPAYKINACKMKIEAGDGIKVECIQGGYKISACCTKAICIKSGTGISVTKDDNTYTITNTAIQEAIEVVEGEGIKVTQTGNKYKVSLASSEESTEDTSGYIFDPEWFTVTGNNVTIKESKVQAVGDGIAVNTSVNANITRVMERTITGNGYEGDIMARITGLEGGLCATASVTWESGTHGDG